MPSPLAPRYWGVHLLALVLALAAVGLGVWQYDAWSERRAAEAVDLTRHEPVPLSSVMGPDSPFPGDKVGQPVVLDGTWVPGGTLFISGRVQDGHEGYWVVTPLAIGGPHASAIPVVRGWVAHTAQAPAPPTGRAKMVGWLQPPEGTGEMDTDPTDDVLPQLRTADVIQHVDQDLYGAYAVVADKAAPGSWPVGKAALNDGTTGLTHADLEQLPSAGAFTALRNLFYAIEWWFFAGFALFVWWRWTQDLRREDEPGDPDDPDGPAVPGDPGDPRDTETGATPDAGSGDEPVRAAADGQ